jgi:hypothetical protein
LPAARVQTFEEVDGAPKNALVHIQQLSADFLKRAARPDRVAREEVPFAKPCNDSVWNSRSRDLDCVSIALPP